MFLTADTHFFHKKMISFRGFDNVEAMNEVLIKRWNEKISNKDIVYHLGDFSFGNKEKTLSILRRLHGKIHLIKGNHDRSKGEVKNKFESIQDYLEIKAPDGRKIVLSHYPHLVWNKSHYGSWHFHGHSHGSLEWNDPKNPKFQNVKRIDVGVDTNNLFPYHISEVKEIMDTRGFEAVDHHVRQERK